MTKSLRASTSLSRPNFDAIRLAIEYVVPRRVWTRRRKIRKHGLAQIKKLAAGIDRHGFNVPIIVDEELAIVSGHARLEAAELLGLSEVPIIRLSHLTEEQLRLFAMFDNKIAEDAEWDEKALVLEFNELKLEEPELELTDSGFEIAEIDAMAGRARTAALSDLDSVAEPNPNVPAVSRIGDLWICGRHRLICGDCTDPAVIARLTDGAHIRQIIADPPYNLKTKAFSSTGLHADFKFGAGEMSPAEFTDFLARFMLAAKPSLADGAFVYTFMDHKHVEELLVAGRQAGFSYVQMLVWIKSQAGMGSFYRSGHELCGVFRHGEAKGRNNIMLGASGRNRSNVMNYPGVRGKAGGGAKALAMHPTVKNIAMIADLMLDASGPGEAILDSFGGSGTTLIAAQKVDRTAYLCEFLPGYVDVAIQRFNALKDDEARLADTGQTFAEVAAERRASAGGED